MTTTHTLYRSGPGSFSTELSASTRAGLTGGLSLMNDPGLGAELAYRQERALAVAAARRARREQRHDRDDGGTRKKEAREHRSMTRWASWLPSVRRSSAAGMN